jgi:hypothetical protein
MSSVAAGGISLGAVVLVGGVIVVAGIVYLVYKNKDVNAKKTNKPMKKLLDDDDKYNTYKTIIEGAIKEKDWQTLKDFLDSRAKNYPDLIDMINEALKERK